jgi:uncharacterized cupredoxin-like copper-binding protein
VFRISSIAVLAATVLLGAGAGQALAAGKRPQAAKVTTVTVTAGKPSEFAFKLSKKQVAPGPVAFVVRNAGKIQHSFKVCASPKGGSANACVGKSTPVLDPGKSATLKLTLKKGTYEYLCTVTGHAAAGMKGVLGVGMAPVVPTAAKTTTTTATAAGPKTTVQVQGGEFWYKISQSSIPQPGTVVFQFKNVGTVVHDFFVLGINKGTRLLSPGQSTTLTVVFTKPGTYTYECTVGEHAVDGMIGQFTVK